MRATFDETTKDIALRNEFDEGALLPVHDYFGPSKVDVKVCGLRPVCVNVQATNGTVLS